MWYTKREQSVLTSLWYCMTGVQLMVIYFPMSRMTLLTLAGWRHCCMGRKPLYTSCPLFVATSLPRLGLRDLCLGALHWVVAARLSHESALFLRRREAHDD